jgi:rfaE bifunctional protein kinase chain/domain
VSEPTSKRWRQIIGRLGKAHVAVVGDLIADEFIYGDVERVSREAPVLILRYDSTEIVPGGGGNAANNAAALGARVDVIGVVGKDEGGRRLLDALPRNARTRAVLRASAYPTPMKTRILAGGIHSAKQQVVRIDRAGGPTRPAFVDHVERELTRALVSTDVVIVSDYGRGLVTPETWARARRAAGTRARALTIVDSRYALTRFEGMTACTPNEPEVESMLGVRIGDDGQALERAGRELLRRLRSAAVLVTRGSRGMALFERDKPTDHIPIVGTDQIADVTGAGDTVIATFATALASGASFREAARLANHAGGLVVMKRGTATVTASELRLSVLGK